MERRLAFGVVGLTLFISGGNLHAAAGRTAGQFAVSQLGSAQYSIVIWTPPGIRAMQPHLSLVYDSHVSYGLMGPGWSISGLSTIARCNPTFAQDAAPAPITLTTADGLCLDGKRLRTTSTGVYQTEVADFSQVTASGTAGAGPSYFTVQAKNGLTYEYGNTTNSKILPCTSSCSTPYIWALDKVTDRSGNNMTFTYAQANGSYVPVSIQYTATTASSSYPYQVSFAYTSKATSDITSAYVAASQIQQTQQLSTITVTSSGTNVREYKLLYTTSTATLRATLTSVQECGDGGTDCLLATTIGYEGGTAGVASPTTSASRGTTNGAVYSVDIDGDGKQDLVFATTSGSNYQWWVQFATATGYGAPISTGAVTVGTTDFLLDDFDGQGGAEILAPVSGVFKSYKWNGTSFAATSTGTSVIAGAQYSSADVDGDGLPDLVGIVVSGANFNEDIQLNTSSGGTVAFVTTPVVNTVVVGYDMTGLQVFGNNQLINSSVRHFDFDGDGRQDLLLYYRTIENKMGVYNVGPMLSRGTAAPAFSAGLGSLSGEPNSFEVVNWNDDQCNDIIEGAVVLIVACNGSLGTSFTLPYAPTLALDWDGDGRTDVLANVSGTWEVMRSEGSTFAPAAATGISVGTGTYFITDQNGDGLDDIAFASASASYAIDYGLHKGAGQPPDLVSSFTDGYGNFVDISYISIAQNNYSESWPTAPVGYQNFTAPYYVVAKATFSDPSDTAPTYYQNFWYANAWMNIRGRGFGGFEAYQRYDSRNTLWETWNLERTFPYTGMLDSDWVAQDNFNSIWVNNFSTTLTYNTLSSTTYEERYSPYASATNDLVYEVGGSENAQEITSVATNYTYDNYGNATTVKTVTTDTDPNSPFYTAGTDTWTTTTVNTISPDTSTWCLGLASGTTVTNSSTVPTFGASIVRTVSYTPDYTYCRETQKVTEPSSGTYKVTEAYGYDTTVGNLLTDTVTGLGMTARVTTLTWDAAGQFVTTMKNPLSQSVTLTHDPNNGTVLSQTDPNYTTSNKLMTSWTYDDFARKTKETRPDNTYTTWSYNDCSTDGGCFFGSHAMTIDRVNFSTTGTYLTSGTTYFDQVDRPLIQSQVMLTGVSRNEVRYDPLGRVTQQMMPCTLTVVAAACPYSATYGYDLINRVRSAVRPINAVSGSSTQSTTYGYVGRTSTVKDALNNTTTKINYVVGPLAQSQDAKSYYQKFSYDSFGALVKTTDSASNTLFTATYHYGVQAFKTQAVDMDLGTWNYTVDALGEVTSYTDAKSQSFTTTYDLLSRPLVRTEPDSPSGSLVTTWTWGNAAASYNIGRLQSVTQASSLGSYIDAYTYDNVTRLSTNTKTLPGDAAYVYTYTYNATTGLLSTVKYPASTSSYQMALQYGYTNNIVSSITDTQTGTAYWTANTDNPRGQVIEETLGNSVVTNRAYDAVTGWVGSIQAGVSGGSTLQNNAFLYDDMGNVTQRQDNNQGLTENFYYDADYRLDHSNLNGTLNLQMAYDTAGMGNIASRSDVASGAAWTYDPVRKHAVTQAGSSSYTYTYDANGNAITRNGSTVSWTSYNYPDSVATSTESAAFEYGPDRQRWRTVYSGSIGTETTYHVGKLLEKVANGGVLDYRHYIFAGNELVAIYSRQSLGTNTLHYILEDHQSSFANILTSSGTSDVSESFTAYGNRRSGESWSGAPSTADETAINGVSRQGYTGQTALGVSMGLNHMNGRVQDSITGRFLSPDPNIGDLGNTQSFNRYSYVNNNPLTNIDPSGFFSLGNLLNPISNSNPLNPFGSFGRKLAALPFTSQYAAARFGQRQGDSLLLDYRWLQPIAETAACIWGTPYGCAAASAYLTRLDGGSIDQALLAGVTAYASVEASAYVDSFGYNEWANIPLKGAISGATAAANAGSFGTGFLFGAVAESAYGIYSSLTYETNPVWNPGGDAVDKDPTSAEYEPAYPASNNVGIATTNAAAQAGQLWPLTEGSVFSNALNQWPGFNSFSTLHDYLDLTGLLTVPSMIPAFFLNYAALSGSIPLCAAGRSSPCH